MTSATQPPRFSLPEGEVHLWLLPERQADIRKMRTEGASLLSNDEQQRLRGMKHKVAADRFLLGRILLRQVLARYLGANPASIKFQYNANGKPELTGPLAQQLSFNLSHSGPDAVLAVSKAPAIGVDLESMDRADAAHRISRRFFSTSEIRELERLGSKASARALMIWALKECIVKANGDSVWDGLAKLSLAIENPWIKWTSCENGVSSNFQLASGAFRENFILALAVKSSSDEFGKPLVFQTYRFGSNTLEENGFVPDFTK